MHFTPPLLDPAKRRKRKYGDLIGTILEVKQKFLAETAIMNEERLEQKEQKGSDR